MRNLHKKDGPRAGTRIDKTDRAGKLSRGLGPKGDRLPPHKRISLLGPRGQSRSRHAVIKFIYIAAQAFTLFLLGTLPTAAQKIYYEAPFGEAPFPPGKGTWTIRRDLRLPTTNKPSDLSRKELINEGLPGNDQKYLGLGRAYGLECSPHICAPTFLSLILWFAPKATANLKLIFETTDPLFHALGVGGGPIWIGTPRNGPDYHVYPDNANYARVWNTGHHSKNNMSIAVQLPWPNPLSSGQIMELLIDNVPLPVGEGRNRMWVIAE
jgi:hypothetical protein